MMVLSAEDKILIKSVYTCKVYSAIQLTGAYKSGSINSFCKMSMSHRRLVKYPAWTTSRRSVAI